MHTHLLLSKAPALHVLRLAFLLNVVALLSPVRNSLWDLSVALTPWLWMLIWPAARVEASRLARRHADLVTASALISMLILIGAISRGLIDEEWRLACVPPIWLPIAALSRAFERDWPAAKHPGLDVALASSVLIIAGTCIWQLLVEHQPRPQGVFFGVLNGPLVLMTACLMWASPGNHQAQDGHRWQHAIMIAAVFGSIATRAKTPFMAFVVATLLALLLDRHNWRRTLTISVPVIGFWGVFLRQRFVDVGSDVATYRSGQFSSSAGDRLDALLWAQYHLLDHPWLGYGPSQLTEAFNGRWLEWGRAESSITKIYHLHNEYLQLPLAHGAPAFIVVIVFWALLSHAIYSSQAPKRAKIPLWLMISILATTSSTDCFSFWLAGWAACFTLAGLAVATIAKHEDPHPQ